MKKRLLSFLVAGTMVAGTAVGLAGCGSKADKLLVWGSSQQQALLTSLISEFKEANPDIDMDIEVGIVGESDAYAQLSNDPQAGADVFAYANDQLMNLITIGALSRLGNAAVTNIKENNDTGSVASGQVGDYYYGYPYSSDNGFFMFYDKSIISAEDAVSLDTVLQRCKENNKYFIYDIDNSWYVGAFLYGVGGEYEVVYNELGSVDSITTNMDQKPAGSDLSYGEIGGTALINLNLHKYFINGDDNVITTYLDEKGFGACISGTWKSAEIASKLGDNYAATRCPDFTGGDGNSYHMVAFSGYKLFGVNAFSKYQVESHKLAAFLSNKESQQKRFDQLKIGPSNKEVAASEAVKSDIALSALNLQMQDGFYKVQGSLPPTYWTAMETFGTDIFNKATTASNLKEAVDTLTTNLKKLTAAS